MSIPNKPKGEGMEKQVESKRDELTKINQQIVFLKAAAYDKICELEQLVLKQKHEKTEDE